MSPARLWATITPSFSSSLPESVKITLPTRGKPSLPSWHERGDPHAQPGQTRQKFFPCLPRGKLLFSCQRTVKLLSCSSTVTPYPSGDHPHPGTLLSRAQPHVFLSITLEVIFFRAHFLVFIFWTHRLLDQPGQQGNHLSLRLGVEVFPEVQFLGWSFRFGPKGQLALHVFSPPLKGRWVLALKHRAYGGKSQPLYVHVGGGQEIRS